MANEKYLGIFPSPKYSRPSLGDHEHSLGELYERTQSMSSSNSPPQVGGPADGQDKGPLGSMNLGFLKTLTEKKTTREGQAPKRRGPKPDSKPALTRRQELNRQAQRTHRERKELYIKALEDEVLRLKEVFSNVTQDKDKLAEENRQLKLLLAQNGSIGNLDDMTSTPSLGYNTSSPSVSGRSGSYAPASSATAYTPPMTSQSSNAPPSQMMATQPSGLQQQQSQHSRSLSQQQRVDYEQAGIDFVLTLEAPCMDHMPWLVERASEAGGDPCGHALMASCPPEPFNELNDEIPFGYKHGAQPEQNRSGQRTWELSKADLATLLDLSKKLDLDGEITPVMAWGVVLQHPRFAELRIEDFQKLSDDLKGKVRCYGFGAVLEEFEVRDALNAVFSTKPELNVAF